MTQGTEPRRLKPRALSRARRSPGPARAQRPRTPLRGNQARAGPQRTPSRARLSAVLSSSASYPSAPGRGLRSQAGGRHGQREDIPGRMCHSVREGRVARLRSKERTRGRRKVWPQERAPPAVRPGSRLRREATPASPRMCFPSCVSLHWTPAVLHMWAPPTPNSQIEMGRSEVGPLRGD